MVLVGGKSWGIGGPTGNWPCWGSACGEGTPEGGGTGIVPARVATPVCPS